MGLFDFLKGAEFAKIAQLERKLQDKEDDILKLTTQVSSLSKYQEISNVDAAISSKLAELENEKQKYISELSIARQSIDALELKYNEDYKIYENLKRQNDLYSEAMAFYEYGIYEPHFNFDSSDKFKAEILKIREQQKSQIIDEVGGIRLLYYNSSFKEMHEEDKKEGRHLKKLLVRVFNGECDNFIANVTWNNVTKTEERIRRSALTLNKHATGFLIVDFTQDFITPEYVSLKLDELRLTYEYRKKKQEEKEEQQEIKNRMREEEKAQREIEAAQAKAEKEEATYQKALEKARNEVENAVGDKHDELLRQIAELESRLSEAEQNKVRALSMAQQTRRGHVYVISNIGSFGENIYKIGMTRRLEPMDRVKELGDASVPFEFDIHALIFSEDAPTLESTLHKSFETKRVNMVNLKREFFNVTLSEIEDIVTQNHGSIEFTKIAEAEQYRETLLMRNRITQGEVTYEQFPSQL